MTTLNKVLIIDDEISIRNLCSKALNKIGIDTVEAESAEDGIKILESERVSVVLLDINLPGINGIEMLGKIKEKSPEIEVIMITGNATIKDAVDAMKKGAYEFITKPFEIFEARHAVQKAFEKSQLRQQVSELEDIVSISEVARAIGRKMTVEELLEIVFNEAIKTVHADGGSIAMFDPDTQELIVSYAEGKNSERALGQRLKIGERICGYAAEKRKSVLVNGPLNEDERFKDTDVLDGVKSGMSIPMIVQDNLVGIINFSRMNEKGQQFTDYDLKIATIFAQQVALAVQNTVDYERLKELDDLKTEFIANVSHELKTPLQSILNASELLITKDKSNKLMKVLIRNAKRMKELVVQLLDFSKLESGEYKLEFEKTDINNLISETIEDLSGEASKKSITLNDSVPELPAINLSRSEIKRVLLNILNNAIKYCPEGSEVTVSVMDNKEELILSIEDNGPGIKDEEKAHIFDKFYQQSPGISMTDKHSGIGLGLSMVKEIILLHRGRIWVESEFGKGSKFILSLPKNLS